MVVMAMVIAMEVMVIDKFQNICQQGGDGFDDGVDMLLSLANRIGMVVVVMFRSNLIIFCNFQQYRLRLRLLWIRNRARQRLISTPLT